MNKHQPHTKDSSLASLNERLVSAENRLASLEKSLQETQRQLKVQAGNAHAVGEHTRSQSSKSFDEDWLQSSKSFDEDWLPGGW